MTRIADPNGAAEEQHDSIRRPAPPAPPRAVAAPSSDEIGKLFSLVAVRRIDRGDLVIEALPEAASTLAAGFQGFVQMLPAAAGKPS